MPTWPFALSFTTNRGDNDSFMDFICIDKRSALMINSPDNIINDFSGIQDIIKYNQVPLRIKQ